MRIRLRGTHFIVCFQVLLLVSGLLLIGGEFELANEIVIGAYFLLVAGVVLQLVSSKAK